MGLLRKLFGNTASKSILGKIGLPIYTGVDSQITVSDIRADDVLKKNLSYVYACVDAIATEFSVVPNTFHKRDEALTEIYDHPAQLLLEEPNPEDTAVLFKYGVAVFWLLVGEVFIEITRSKKDNTPIRLDLIYPPYVQMNRTSDGKKLYHYSSWNGTTRDIPEENMLVFRKYNTQNRYRGFGAGMAVVSTVDNLLYSQEFLKKFFENGAILSGFLETDQEMNENEVKTVKSDFKAKFQGFINSFEVPVMTNGLKYTPVSPTLKDMDLTPQFTLNKEEILRVFRTPESVLGSNDSNRASAEAADYSFMKHAVNPLCIFWDDFLQGKMIRGTYNDKLTIVRHENIIPEDSLQNSTVQQNASGILTIDERREIMGKPPLPDGSGNVISSGVTNPLDPTQLNSLKSADEFNVDAFKSAYVEKVIKLEVGLKKAMAKEFKRQRDEILEKIGMLGGVTPSTQLINLDFENTKIGTTLTKHYLKATQRGIDQFYQYLHDRYNKHGFVEETKRVGLQGNPLLQGIMSHLAQYYANKINIYTNEKLTETVQNSINAGEGVGQLADSIKGLFNTFAEGRARKIGRTEVNRAQNYGNHYAIENEPLVDRKKWVAIHDKWTRKSHTEVDGITLDKTKKFQVPKAKGGFDFMNHPHDADASAENTIECRCTEIALLKE